MTLLDNKHIIKNNDFPGIESINDVNPTLTSPFSPYELPFYQTRETLLNTDTYREFLKNAISAFRKSRTYTHYKGFLMGLGLDRCQVHGNITAEMATIEMHHNMLTLFDIALIITEHVLNTKGYISTFDLVTLLKEEHKQHNVQLVMLSLTPHQLYHNTDDFYIHPDHCIGNWYRFLEKYHTGITLDIAYKLLNYIKEAIEKGSSDDGNLLKIREQILDWSEYNARNFS